MGHFLTHSCVVVFFGTTIDPDLKTYLSLDSHSLFIFNYLFKNPLVCFIIYSGFFHFFLSFSFVTVVCVNSISRVLQRCCCDVCLRYISRKLQQLRHSPHYINPLFILKCVPACLALQNVQGKGICFFPLPPLPKPLSPVQSWPMGRWQKQKGGGGGGMTNGLWAVSREGRRCQSHESVDACEYTPPPLHLCPSLTQLPPPSPSISPSSLPPLSFLTHRSNGTILITTNRHSCPHLLPGPHNYLLASLIRERWSDKSALCVRKYACAQSLGMMTLAGSHAGSNNERPWVAHHWAVTIHSLSLWSDVSKVI